MHSFGERILAAFLATALMASPALAARKVLPQRGTQQVRDGVGIAGGAATMGPIFKGRQKGYFRCLLPGYGWGAGSDCPPAPKHSPFAGASANEQAELKAARAERRQYRFRRQSMRNDPVLVCRLRSAIASRADVTCRFAIAFVRAWSGGAGLIPG